MRLGDYDVQKSSLDLKLSKFNASKRTQELQLNKLKKYKENKQQERVLKQISIIDGKNLNHNDGQHTITNQDNPKNRAIHTTRQMQMTGKTLR